MLHLIAKGRLTQRNGHEPSHTDDNTAQRGLLIDRSTELNGGSNMRDRAAVFGMTAVFGIDDSGLGMTAVFEGVGRLTG
jgi:hypothetical protein